MQVEIITIGDEVLSGRTVDTNFAFLARALEAAGVQVGWHTTVGDSSEWIDGVLRAALARAEAVVMTGGLGPTPDDLTREAVAGCLELPLERSERVLDSLRDRASRYGRPLSPAAESQALMPRGAEAWPNPLGTAPGILILHAGKPVVLLPGVPAEMEAIATAHLVPYLKARSSIAVESFTLRTAGVFETWLHQKIGRLPEGWPGGTLAYLPGYQGVDLRVTVTGPEAEKVRTVSRQAYQELRASIGPVVYAEGERGLHRRRGEHPEEEPHQSSRGSSGRPAICRRARSRAVCAERSRMIRRVPANR